MPRGQDEEVFQEMIVLHDSGSLGLLGGPALIAQDLAGPAFVLLRCLYAAFFGTWRTVRCHEGDELEQLPCAIVQVYNYESNIQSTSHSFHILLPFYQCCTRTSFRRYASRISTAGTQVSVRRAHWAKLS